MTATLPKARDLVLKPGEAAPEVAHLHSQVLAALVGADLPKAQRLSADLLDMLGGLAKVTYPKTRQLIEFVVLLS